MAELRSFLGALGRLAVFLTGLTKGEVEMWVSMLNFIEKPLDYKNPALCSPPTFSYHLFP